MLVYIQIERNDGTQAETVNVKVAPPPAKNSPTNILNAY